MSDSQRDKCTKEEEKWVEIRADRPCFSDPGLTTRSALHKDSCSRRDRRIRPEDDRCRCRTATWRFQIGDRVEILERSNHAVLVKAMGRTPVWIEPGGLRDCPRPPGREEVRKKHDVPKDFLSVETSLAHGCDPIRRRRRVPIGGEIVYLRSDLDGQRTRPWRFLFVAHEDERMKAMLVEPSVPLDQALLVGWEQRIGVDIGPIGQEIDRALDGAMVAAFPLPNGVEDPGWTSHRES